jgi:nucleoside 2-deoxyribosyltransferase
LLGEEYVVDVARRPKVCNTELRNLDQIAEDIVEADLRELQQCDVVLCCPIRPGFGTMGEIVYASSMMKHNLIDDTYEDASIPVVTVVPDAAKMSPWLRYYSSYITTTLEDAVQYIKEMFK